MLPGFARWQNHQFAFLASVHFQEMKGKFCKWVKNEKKVKVNQLEKKSKSKSIVKRCRWISGAWPEGKRFQNAPQGIPNPHMGTHPQISWVSHCPNTSRVGWKILKMVTHLYLLYSHSTHGHPSANLPL